MASSKLVRECSAEFADMKSLQSASSVELSSDTEYSEEEKEYELEDFQILKTIGKSSELLKRCTKMQNPDNKSSNSNVGKYKKKMWINIHYLDQIWEWKII